MACGDAGRGAWPTVSRDVKPARAGQLQDGRDLVAASDIASLSRNAGVRGVREVRTGPPWVVVVSDYTYADLSVEREELAALGADVRIIAAQCRTEDDLAEVGAAAHAVLNQYCPVGRRAMDAMPHCRVISRYGVGFDTVDLRAAAARGIVVANVPDYCVDEVSDHALALLLAWARGVVALDAAVRSGGWSRPSRPARRLRGQTLGLVGFGRMAQALAAKAAPLGLEVLAADPFLPPEAIRDRQVEPVTLEELLERADFISVHVPLSERTRGLLGAEAFGRTKPSALLINTSRGAVVDEPALVEALRAGRLAGAALDVLAAEPPAADHPLLGLPGVILTPHIAWRSVASEVELRRKCARNVVDTLMSGAPAYPVPPPEGDGAAQGEA